MTVSGITDYFGYDPDYVPAKAGDVLDKYDFLKLIITQLEYQDPLEPLKSTEFMTQMTAMGQLEQMQNLNTNFEQMMTTNGLVYGSQLIGQTVQAVDQTTRSIIEGVVGQVSIQDGAVQIQVGESTVALEDLVAVTPWTDTNSILQASRMIGLNVMAIDPDDYLGFNTISGTVEEARVSDGTIMLKFTDTESGNEYEIALEDVLSVSRAVNTADGE